MALNISGTVNETTKLGKRHENVNGFKKKRNFMDSLNINNSLSNNENKIF